MSVKITFDDKIRQWIGEAEDMELTANTVHQALLQVARAYPSLHMFNCDGELRAILRVYRNGQPARVLEALEDGDTVRLSVGASD